MPVIRLQTIINAPVQIVFDLSRSIDLHTVSTAHTNEKAVAGKTSGLIAMGETVTWQAKHFGITQELTSVITAFNPPYNFTDEMGKGVFKRFRHVHIFEEKDGAVVMKDVFDYTSPLGVLGKIADALFLKNYMEELLVTRNRFVKEFAEDAEKYKKVLPL